MRYLTIVGLLLLSHNIVYSESNPMIETILSYQKMNLERIRSIEFSSTSRITFNAAEFLKLGATKNTLEYEFKFAYDLPRYRCDLTYEDMTGKQTSFTNAYNGEIYQRLEDSFLAFSHILKTDNPYGYLNPIIVPFFFAFERGSILDVATLKLPEVWSRLEAIAIERGSQVKNGHDCVILEFPGSTMAEAKVIHTVFFAKDLNYFPIYWRITLPQGMARSEWSEMNIVETIKVGEDPNAVWLPIKLEGNYAEGEQEKVKPMFMAVDSNSIKINQGIKEEIFTIPITQADTVIDADLGVIMNPGSDVIRTLNSN